MAPEIMPVLDPADHALMLTPEQLKNQGSKNSNVSFLRKTQYITSQNARGSDPLTRTNPRATLPARRASMLAEAHLARDNKENINRHIQKGFDIAYPDSTQQDITSAPATTAEREAWQNPVHPDNPRLKPVSHHPLLPDFDAVPDQGAYISVKFDKPPLPSRRGRRDDRVDVAMLRASVDPRRKSTWEAKKAAFLESPEKFEDPGPEPVIYAYEVPESEEGASRIRRILNDADPDKDDFALWEGFFNPEDVTEETSEKAEPYISYAKIRSFPNNSIQEVNSSRFLALSLIDPDTAPPQSRLNANGPAAYFYPIKTRTKLRADRGKVGRMPQAANADDDDSAADRAGTALRFSEPSIATQYSRLDQKNERDPETFGEEFERINAIVQAEYGDKDQPDSQEHGELDDQPDVSMNGHLNGVTREQPGAEYQASHATGRQADEDPDADADAMDDS